MIVSKKINYVNIYECLFDPGYILSLEHCHFLKFSICTFNIILVKSFDLYEVIKYVVKHEKPLFFAVMNSFFIILYILQ